MTALGRRWNLRRRLPWGRKDCVMPRWVLGTGAKAFLHGLAKHIIDEQPAGNGAMAALLAESA